MSKSVWDEKAPQLFIYSWICIEANAGVIENNLYKHTFIFMRMFFQVSWIRKRDLHILTAGVLTYTSDQRFQVSKISAEYLFAAFQKENKSLNNTFGIYQYWILIDIYNKGEEIAQLQKLDASNKVPDFAGHGCLWMPNQHRAKDVSVL